MMVEKRNCDKLVSGAAARRPSGSEVLTLMTAGRLSGGPMSQSEAAVNSLWGKPC